MAEGDDVCAICNETRENHGDKHHRFSTDGQLIEIPPAGPAKKTPPNERDERKRPEATPEGRAFATLMEVLVEKSILDAKDIIRVFGGNG